MLDWGERREKQGKEKREKAEIKNKKLKIRKESKKRHQNEFHYKCHDKVWPQTARTVRLATRAGTTIPVRGSRGR